MRPLKALLNLKEVDQLILWKSVPIGRFFVLRMSEFLITDQTHDAAGRHPIPMDATEPICKGSPTNWGDRADEVRAYISEPKTDWPNQGCVRSHTRVRSDSPNADICAVESFVALFKEFPENSHAKVTNPCRLGGTPSQFRQPRPQRF